MANAVGIKVQQFDKLNNYIATFSSIAEASRQTGIPKSTIKVQLKRGSSEKSEFIWKTAA